MTAPDWERDEQPATGRAYTPERVIAALRASSGIASGAAKDLDCSRKVVMDYIHDIPQIQAAYDELREESVDMAEREQLDAMGRKERWAIENWLFNSKQGRARGWLKHAEGLADAGLLNAIQIYMPHNERDDVAVSVQQFDAPPALEGPGYVTTVAELNQQKRTAHLNDSHDGLDPLFELLGMGSDDDEDDEF